MLGDQRTKAVTGGLKTAREAAEKAVKEAEAAAGVGAGPDGAVAAAKKALATAQTRVEKFAKKPSASSNGAKNGAIYGRESFAHTARSTGASCSELEAAVGCNYCGWTAPGATVGIDFKLRSLKTSHPRGKSCTCTRTGKANPLFGVHTHMLTPEIGARVLVHTHKGKTKVPVDCVGDGDSWWSKVLRPGTIVSTTGGTHTAGGIKPITYTADAGYILVQYDSKDGPEGLIQPLRAGADAAAHAIDHGKDLDMAGDVFFTGGPRWERMTRGPTQPGEAGSFCKH
jgi:hypothetical protein